MNNDSYAVFIIAHENLAASLKRTLQKIIGNQDNLFAFSNRTFALHEIEQRINNKIKKLNSDRNILFADLVGGSCWSLANLMKKKNESLTVIGGINMAMLVSFFLNYKNMNYDDLIEKIVSDGKKGINLVPGKL